MIIRHCALIVYSLVLRQLFILFRQCFNSALLDSFCSIISAFDSYSFILVIVHCSDIEIVFQVF
jgi:hypothetical protein